MSPLAATALVTIPLVVGFFLVSRHLRRQEDERVLQFVESGASATADEIAIANRASERRLARWSRKSPRRRMRDGFLSWMSGRR